MPLMGTRGCINYNPVLCMRKFGHFMDSPPNDKFIEPFILHDITPSNLTITKVKKTLVKIIRKGQELGKNNVIAREPYTQWIRERVKVIKLPCIFDSPTFSPVPEPMPILVEEVKEL